MSDLPTKTTEEADLDDLLRKARIGVPSYPEVIPELIREIGRLRSELKKDRIWQATRDAGMSS